MAADDELKKMERYLSKIFTEAGKDLTQKALKYMADFERKEKVKLEKVSSGQITEDEYKEWRKNQLLYGEHWTRLIQLVQKEMADCNKTALDYVNDKATKIFADSYNSIARVIDDSVVEGYSFELVDANTVKNLARSEGIILPPKKNLDVQKDKLWNAKQVNAQLLQGILQGESIPKIAARMQNVCDSNKAASIRNARTMVTAAENSGRQSGMNKAESDGIIFKKMWIATRDERTRESHMVLNGQLVANGEKFVTINGDEIEFPGDWRAEPSEVYNCRCTLGTIVTGYKPDVLREKLEEEQKEQEQEAQEGLKVEETAEGYNERFEFALDIQGREDVETAINNLSGREKEIWENNIALANYTVLESSGDESEDVAYNVQNTRDVFLFPESDARTALHETAHSMDWFICTMEYATGGYKEMLGERIEIEPWKMEYVGASRCARAIFAMDEGNDWGKATREDLVSIYKWANVMYVSDQNPSLADFPSACKDIVKAVREFEKEYGVGARRNLSDMIEATTRGNIPLILFPGCGGHGEDYWKGDVNNEFAEGWAEFCQMKAQKQDKAIEAIRAIMPNKINALEEVYNAVFNGKTYERRVVTDEGYRVSEETWKIRVNI